MEHYPNLSNNVTDRSKGNDKTACGAVLNKTIVKRDLPKQTSIFSVEFYARVLAHCLTCWIPSHTGIKEQSLLSCQISTKMDPGRLKILSAERKNKINVFFYRKLQKN